MHKTSFLSIAFACLASLVLPACADLSTLIPAVPPANAASGRVVGLYVQHAPGVYAERTGSSAEADLPVYAEVRTTPRNGGASQLALVPLQGVDAGLGDTVEVALGERGTAFVTGARAAQARVVRVTGRNEPTLVQRLFDR